MQGRGKSKGRKGSGLQVRELRGWELATMNKGPPFQVIVFFFLLFEAEMHLLVIFVYAKLKRTLSAGKK